MKKITALILSVLLVFTSVGFGAFATEEKVAKTETVKAVELDFDAFERKSIGKVKNK